MVRTAIIVVWGVIFLSCITYTDFLSEQKKFKRVSTAIDEKQSYLEKKLKENNINLSELNLVFVAFKDNDLLEIYAKTTSQISYKKIFSYEICSRSGQLGPKRKQGDGQVPEGFYEIDRFNPSSSFYLSLGINYPNISDIRKSKNPKLGGDIFIHGSCVTIGCLPMTDNYIKEIYLLAVHAKNSGQRKIPVYIFPFKMTDKNMTIYKSKYPENKELTLFWDNLKIGYDKFFKEQKELKIRVTKTGDYSY